MPGVQLVSFNCLSDDVILGNLQVHLFGLCVKEQQELDNNTYTGDDGNGNASFGFKCRFRRKSICI